MRSIILLTIVLRCCLEVQCAPLPADREIKYRVSSKYFSRTNATHSSGEHSRDSLYNLLTQIHFGDATSTAASDESTTTDESPETPTATAATDPAVSDVTEPERPSDEEETSLNALIEKVVNDEIERLATTTITTASVEELEQSTDGAATGDGTAATEEVEAATTTSIIESDDLDSETQAAESSSTNVPSTTDDNTTTHHSEEVEEEDEEEEDDAGNEIPESLLSAVGDLLSSVLGISVVEADDTAPTTSESAVEEEAQAESETSTQQNQATESATAADEGKMTDVDQKIENLNVQNTFVTENAPEFFTEAVKSEEEEVLEVLTPVADEEDVSQPASIEASVNHVMNLIRDAAESTDKQVNDVYTTLQEFGLTEANTEDAEEELKSLATDSFDPETIKTFETDINEMVGGGGAKGEEQEDNFVPNIAKAAMYYKYQYDDDF